MRCANKGWRPFNATILSGILATILVHGQAEAAERAIDFNIPAEPLSKALRDYGRAADRQLIFTEDLVGRRAAPALRGRIGEDAALAKLLAGADLSWRVTEAGAVMIVRKDVAGPQVGAAAVDPSPETVDTVLVVGSRLARLKDGPAPVTVFDETGIRALGAANVSEVLKYLPQQAFTIDLAAQAGGAQVAQLRGLGAGTTLILINGRRVTPGAIGASRTGFDLNTIPLSAVERIEVLSDSASAVYGADAVGGVINVVLKAHFDAPVLDVSYGAADGGAEERRASISLGGRRDRSQGAVMFDYFSRDPLYGRERGATRNADYRAFGAPDRRVLTASPGNVCAVAGNLPGLSAPCAAVPAGSSGVGLTPASFAATAGQQNLYSTYSGYGLIPSSQRYSVTATGGYDISDHLSAFAEVMYADRRDLLDAGPRTIVNGLVPANNPFNPFGVAVRANFLVSSAHLTAPAHETSYRSVVGLKGSSLGWDWEISGLDSRSRGDYANLGSLDSARVSAALAATSPSSALNVFQDGPGGSAALINSLIAVASPTVYSAQARQYSGFARGQLLALPAGALQAAAGAEWRHEAISANSPTSAFNVGRDRAKRDSSSAYVELRAPLIGGPVEVAMLGDVAVTLAGRFDRYSDFGSTFNAQYGVEWRPIPTLLVRGSYGDSYRAPDLFSLFRPQSTSVTTTIDPRRGGETFTASFTSGGNPNLDAEASNSSSLGVVWTPAVAHARLSASLWRIHQDQRIVTTTPASILANEAYFPGRVVRDVATAADVAAGRPGRVLSIDASFLNAGSLDTNGLDLEASGQVETSLGLFSPGLRATRIFEFRAADFPTTPATDKVGLADFNGSVPKWKGVASLGWRRGGLNIVGTARYTAAYADTTFNVRNGLKVGASLLFDLQASFDLDALGLGDRADGLARGTVVRVGASNLFDKAPPFSDVLGKGYDPTQGDYRQRFVYASVSKAF